MGCGNIYLRLFSSSHLIFFLENALFFLVHHFIAFYTIKISMQACSIFFYIQKTWVALTIWQNRCFPSAYPPETEYCLQSAPVYSKRSLCLSSRQMETFQHNSGAKWREEFHFTYVSCHPKWHTDIPNKACDFSNGGKLHHAESVSDPICERCFLRTLLSPTDYS